MMDTTVYTAVKAPMKGLHDLQKCRIGLCNGTPTLEDGWILFSSLITDDAEKIYAAVRKTDLHRLPQGNYDAGDDSWLVPIFVLDGWVTSKEELIHLKSTVRHPVQYFRHCDEGKGTSCLDYIDFIDAPAVRDHLRRLPPLPPAQQCILIAQSYIRPLTDKLAALNAIRDATPPEDFSRGCWKFQCDDPFPVILDRYLRTRAERLVTFRKAEPGVVYVVESGYRNDSALFSTFDAALASVKELEDDESPPVIRRRRIDDTDGATLVAELSRKLEIAEIDVRGGPDAGNMRIWGGDLPNGYAHVPHPFKRGDIVRQGDAYFVLDGRSDEGGRFSWGTDEDDMQLYGMSWDKPSGSFCHEHIFYTRGSTELVAPADLPEKERMLAAVSLLMRGEYDLINFLQCFTCGDRKTLETDAIADAKREASPKKRKDENRILRSDLPGLPANLFLRASSFCGFPKTVRVQRSGDTEPHYRDTVELTIEAAPRFNGGTGDLSPDDVQTICDLVARHLDAFLANWDGKMSSDDLLAALRDGTRPDDNNCF